MIIVQLRIIWRRKKEEEEETIWVLVVELRCLRTMAFYALSRTARTVRRFVPTTQSYFQPFNCNNSIHSGRPLSNLFEFSGSPYSRGRLCSFSYSLRSIGAAYHEYLRNCYFSTEASDEKGDTSKDSNRSEGNHSWIDVTFPEKARPYAHLARLDKPIGTWLLAWPCMW